MSRLFYHVMQDNLGNLLFDVSGTMRVAGTGTAATIYGDEALTVPIANPMTNHPSFGSFKCFLGVGDYDFYMAKSGHTFETLTGVQGWGTMALQNANNVAITGGSAQLGGKATAFYLASPNAEIEFFNGPVQFGGNMQLSGQIGVHSAPQVNYGIYLVYNSVGAQQGMAFQPSTVGSVTPLIFVRADGAAYVGNISTTDTTTTYNTSSDARLKHAIAPLTGALDAVRALNPVSFLWKADGTPGRGFLAGEVQEVIPDGVITGERGAIDDDGRILPQMIDYSKLVPYLVGAVKELTQQVEMLQAQLAAAGA